MLYISDAALVCITPNVSLLRDRSEPVRAFSLTTEDHAFFQNHIDIRFRENVKSRLYEKLAAAPEEQIERIPEVVDHCFHFIKLRSHRGLVSSRDCETLSILVLMWGVMAQKIMHGPLLNDPLLGISQRIELVRESHFDMPNKIRKVR
jgi:hypothetical protein